MISHYIIHLVFIVADANQSHRPTATRMSHLNCTLLADSLCSRVISLKEMVYGISLS